MVVPVIQLAKKAGLKIPMAEVVLQLASFLHKSDYAQKGTTLKTLGINDLSIEEIINIVS